jgi:membrane protein DedA with SNARE-associated domain
MIQDLIDKLVQLPTLLIYVVIGAGASTENIIPPIPADTFVLLGAFLSSMGRANAWTVFFVTWLCNIGSATFVYVVARTYGRKFFDMPIGHWLIHPRQMKQIDGFYQKWGTPAIFLSRFLPAFRAMVPVFAGVTHVTFPRVFIPLAAASAIWYGFLVYLGAVAGKNWSAIMRFFSGASTILLIIAVVLITGFGVWWWRSRQHAHH